MWVSILLVDSDSDSDTDSIDTGIDTLGIVDQPGAIFWRIYYANHFINLFVQVFMIADQNELIWIESYEETEKNDFNEVSEQERKKYEAKFRAFKVLGKLHNIIVHIRRSS
jgi:hypothetical protein